MIQLNLLRFAPPGESLDDDDRQVVGQRLGADMAFECGEDRVVRPHRGAAGGERCTKAIEAEGLPRAIDALEESVAEQQQQLAGRQDGAARWPVSPSRACRAGTSPGGLSMVPSARRSSGKGCAGADVLDVAGRRVEQGVEEGEEQAPVAGAPDGALQQESRRRPASDRARARCAGLRRRSPSGAPPPCRGRWRRRRRSPSGRRAGAETGNSRRRCRWRCATNGRRRSPASGLAFGSSSRWSWPAIWSTSRTRTRSTISNASRRNSSTIATTNKRDSLRRDCRDDRRPPS